MHEGQCKIHCLSWPVQIKTWQINVFKVKITRQKFFVKKNITVPSGMSTFTRQQWLKNCAVGIVWCSSTSSSLLPTVISVDSGMGCYSFSKVN